MQQQPDIRQTLQPNNVQVLGLHVNAPVFFISALLAVGFVIGTLAFLESADAAFGALRSWITTRFDWAFMMATNFFLLFCLFVGFFSKFGRVRLGGPEARPEHSYVAWLGMLFTAGVGIGLMFYGAYEPVTHSLHPPLAIDPSDSETSRAAGMSAAIFHWGLHAWATYAVIGLALAFYHFNRGLPLLPRSVFFPLIGKAAWGPIGHVVDITAVIATLFGLATSLGLGAEQMAAGMDYMFGIPPSATTKVLLVLGITALALWAVVAGVEKGIKLMSNVNVVLAAVLLAFVFIAGPTLAIAGALPSTLLDYLYFLPRLSNWIGREDVTFYHQWPIFYWAWWISWSPFVGLFIARISYGRTTREFFTGVLIVPTAIGLLWMLVFGGTALEQVFADGNRAVAEAVPELTLFKMLESLPFTFATSAISMVLIAIFFVTSADSGALVMDYITAGGKLDAPVKQRAFWCILIGLVAIVLLLGGGIVSLQALVISVALPFIVVLLASCLSLLRGLREEIAKRPDYAASPAADP
jgi:betaine/carnitine transporter, BCCT family